MPTTARIHNFSAGPAVLPLPVLEEAQRDLISLPGIGMSVMEISHRSKTFEGLLSRKGCRRSSGRISRCGLSSVSPIGRTRRGFTSARVRVWVPARALSWVAAWVFSRGDAWPVASIDSDSTETAIDPRGRMRTSCLIGSVGS